MPLSRRTLGVRGVNKPTKKAQTVTPADFNIAGLIGKFERQYVLPISTNNPQQAKQIFGDQISASAFGWDSINAFWQNVAGVPSTLWVKAHVGYTGSAIDGASSILNLLDASNPTLKIESAWQGNKEYGAGTVRTSVQVIPGSRFDTALAANVLASATQAQLKSVVNIKVGDVLKFNVTGGPVWKKITVIDEANLLVKWTGVFDASLTGSTNDVVNTVGFQIKTYRKTVSGIVNEVDQNLGLIWCTMEPEVSDFYAPNVFAASNWISVTDLASASTPIQNTFPVALAQTFLVGGSDGTSPTTPAHWSLDVASFTIDIPVRMIANCESTDTTIQKALETAMQARWDTPKVIINPVVNQTKSQLIVLGSGYQRSDRHLGIWGGNWWEVPDPFASSPIAPPREVPPVGHAMGAWCRTIGTFGVHYNGPSIRETPIFGVTGVVGAQFLDDQDRTDLSNYGINVSQQLDGVGFVIRNFFTFSTAEEFQFANGILMQDYIKVSAVSSLQTSENKPNNFARIQGDRMAVLQFLYRLWRAGSTGSVPEGETFGQQINPVTNRPTNPEDHFEVQADTINNPIEDIQNGERNIDTWFTFPAPAGSIQIGVGILLKSN